MNPQVPSKVASCAPIATQPATFTRNSATYSATTNATVSLKASALAALRRNRSATSPQLVNENSATQEAKKQGSKLRSNPVKVERWLRFIDTTVLLGATAEEVYAAFSEQDIEDLLEEPDSKLRQHARTIAEAMHRNRIATGLERISTQTACGSSGDATLAQATPVHPTCGTCRHFQRTRHLHLGHCMAGEPVGTCGNWDTDKRDYCQQFEV